MLEVDQLTRNYGTFVAVDHVSFSIQKGEIVGLLGHNGAGKTTIMKMLSGFLEPDQGSVMIDGVDLQNETKPLQQRLGYLPENLPLYPEMTVVDYLDYAADLKGLSPEVKAVEIRRAVQATEIASKAMAPIATLSRGFKQRVGVAQAILGKPNLLILDEPTNGLDPTQTEHMRQLIRDVAQEATVILSTHIMQEVDAICNRVLILNNGQLAIDAKLSELKPSNQLLIKTDLSADRLQQCCADIQSVQPVQAAYTQAQGYGYRIELSRADIMDISCATIAEAIVAAGGALYQLTPEHRDLETLFREVTQGKVEVEDAA
ncbi:MAG: ABC transporter ATP-binding protein [Gammaproteobacteria bacterium]|nr:ABC transporter ATP-binding protein [Gammaproteobacteria bacterium]